MPVISGGGSSGNTDSIINGFNEKLDNEVYLNSTIAACDVVQYVDCSEYPQTFFGKNGRKSIKILQISNDKIIVFNTYSPITLAKVTDNTIEKIDTKTHNNQYVFDFRDDDNIKGFLLSKNKALFIDEKNNVVLVKINGEKIENINGLIIDRSYFNEGYESAAVKIDEHNVILINEKGDGYLYYTFINITDSDEITVSPQIQLWGDGTGNNKIIRCSSGLFIKNNEKYIVFAGITNVNVFLFYSMIDINNKTLKKIYLNYGPFNESINSSYTVPIIKNINFKNEDKSLYLFLSKYEKEDSTKYSLFLYKILIENNDINININTGEKIEEIDIPDDRYNFIKPYDVCFLSEKEFYITFIKKSYGCGLKKVSINNDGTLNLSNTVYMKSPTYQLGQRGHPCYVCIETLTNKSFIITNLYQYFSRAADWNESGTITVMDVVQSNFKVLKKIDNANGIFIKKTLVDNIDKTSDDMIITAKPVTIFLKK